MSIEAILKAEIQKAIQVKFDITAESIILQPTKKEFEGVYTFVTFPLAKSTKKSPVEIGNIIGDYLSEHAALVKNFNVVQGFLNINLTDTTWIQLFSDIQSNLNFGIAEKNGESVMVEFSSPNTNKPLHLGHLRNNFLGDSLSKILVASGYEVTKACLVNDRGIHICKSMLAYKELGNGETPASSGLKGDHLAGKYYVLFDKAYKQQITELVEAGMPEAEAAKKAPWMLEAQKLLLLWEQGDTETIALWEKMNGWVYDGFNETYNKIGVSFDKTYYESQTYLLGKDIIEEGLQKGVFFKKEDNSVWINLEEEGLDEKLVLRGDGTSVYITQDLGTTELKYKDFVTNRTLWVVGNEQDYHFKVLFAILKRLGRPYADECYHISYGMVDLPSGKMKSREGTVVDADELVAQMVQTAANRTQELGKIDDFDSEEASLLYQNLALGALKYFLLKVDPKKRMLFNPEESIDFQGHTGPFIQYTYARMRSILRKAQQLGLELEMPSENYELHPSERDLIFTLSQYPARIQSAAKDFAPSTISFYAYELAKIYNQFYAEVSIFADPNPEAIKFRIALSKVVSETIKKALGLLGIEVPERM
jgi:arginyl-tRNA synthetase